MAEQMDFQLLISFQEYLVHQGMSPATVKNYLADVNAFARWFGAQTKNGASLLAFSAMDLRAYRTGMSDDGLATSTINRRLQALRKFGQFVVEAGLRTYNPAHDVARLRPGQPQPPRILSSAEADDLLETVLAQAKPSQVHRDYAIVLLLLSCGIQLRELVDLRLEDVDLGIDEGYLMIGSSALDGGRVIPFGAATAAAMAAYLRVRPNTPDEDHFFLSREGRLISPRTIQRLITHYAQAAGLDNVSAQTMRATFAHAMFEGTGDIKVVAKLMGHRSEAVTARYFAG
jgi:site-specific recombinase XerD